jgi:uncharacterized membrane protein
MPNGIKLFVTLFLVLVAIIGGLSYILIRHHAAGFSPFLLFGVLLTAAGGAYLWMNSRFHKR